MIHGPIVERLVWYGGAEVAWYIRDTYELERLLRKGHKKSLIRDLVSTQGFKMLRSIMGDVSSNDISYYTQSPGSITIAMLHIPRCMMSTIFVEDILDTIPLDLRSQDVAVRRLSKLVQILGRRELITPPLKYMRWFIGNVDYNKYIIYGLKCISSYDTDVFPDSCPPLITLLLSHVCELVGSNDRRIPESITCMYDDVDWVRTAVIRYDVHEFLNACKIVWGDDILTDMRQVATHLTADDRMSTVIKEIDEHSEELRTSLEGQIIYMYH
jgi:hypothetical protein